MAEELHIRPAIAGDLETIARFQELMALETEDKALDPALVRRGVQAVFDRPTRGRYWIAERGGAAVGSLLLTFEWSDWRAADFWWIQSVFVVREARGQSVFGALYRHVERAAREEPGVCGLRLYVERDNQHAQRVYEALGMEASHYRLYEVDFVLGGSTGK
ncbi:MAG: GNAT family N-acetyltransferase [Planctomycetota bacterium]